MKTVETTGVREQYKNSQNLDARANLHALYSTNPQGWSNWVYQQMQFPNNAQVLELGCGNGQLWFDNAEELPEDIQCVISDFSEGMLLTARKRLTTIPRDIDFMVIDAQSIPLEDNSFDVCIANHMLYHVSDVDRALSEITRVLKKGATFYATTVGNGHLAEIDEILLSIDKDIDFWHSVVENFNLQNAMQVLENFLTNIEIRAHQDSLEITNEEHLIDYILSSRGISNEVSVLQGKNLDELRSKLRQEILKKGHIKVSKEAGMIIAQAAT